MRRRTMLIPALVLLTGGCEGSGRYEGVIGPPRPVVIVAVRILPVLQPLEVGSTTLLVAVPLDANGNEVTGRTPVWTSSDPHVAHVEASGLVRGMIPGTVTVTAAFDDVTGEVRLTVEPPRPDEVLLGFGWSFEMVGGSLGPVNDVWGSPDGAILWAVGATRLWDCCAAIMRREGGTWNMEVLPALFELSAVWGSSSRDVFFVGSAIVHYDGEHLHTMPSPIGQYLTDVWGSSDTDVFAVGGEGGVATILHYDGQTWTPMVSGFAGNDGQIGWLNGIWGSSGTDVFAVGGRGLILHYDGTSWRAMITPSNMQLNDVWGASGNDVYAVGVGGAILHYDGVAWTEVPSPTYQELTAIHGIAPTEIYAVGSEPLYPACCAHILGFDGTRWTAIASSTPMALFGVWATPGELFAVGAGPTILHGSRE